MRRLRKHAGHSLSLQDNHDAPMSAGSTARLNHATASLKGMVRGSFGCLGLQKQPSVNDTPLSVLRLLCDADMSLPELCEVWQDIDKQQSTIAKQSQIMMGSTTLLWPSVLYLGRSDDACCLKQNQDVCDWHLGCLVHNMAHDIAALCSHILTSSPWCSTLLTVLTIPVLGCLCRQRLPL